MLIVEGNDCVGKTTVVNKLCKVLDEYGFPAIPQHFGILPTNWDYLRQYVPFINPHVVMDRFIMSEVVYGCGLRSKTRLSPETYDRLQAKLTLSGSVNVVVACLDHDVYERLLDQQADRYQHFSRDQLLHMNKVWENACHEVGDFENYDFKIDFSLNVFEVGGEIQWVSDHAIRLIAQEYIRRQRWTSLD